MAEIWNCGCTDCTWNNYGDCEADSIEIDYEMTAAGLQPLCQSYKEKDED